MSDVVIDTNDINIKQTTSVVANNQINVDVITDDPIVHVDSNEFILSSACGYSNGNGLIGAVPNWLLNAIKQELTTGTGNITDLMNDLRTAMDTLSVGVTQSIASLNTASLSQSSLLTGLRSDVNNNNASIINVLATKVDSAQAMAIATDAIQSKFGTDVNAFVGNIASTYVDANSAIAQDMSLITATLNGISSSVSTIATATTEQKINPLWVNDGLGTTPDVNGNDKYITVALAQEQFVVDANGVITSLILSSGATSSITMNADQFKLVASGQSVASRNPFSINATTGEISFNGKVSFSNVTNTPLIPTATSQLTNNSGFTTLSAVDAQGYILPAEVANAINTNTTTIDGSKITTGSIAANKIITTGLVAENIKVYGINNNQPLLTADGSMVTIANLKILGTVSLPGISKFFSFNIPQQDMPAYSNGSGTPVVALITSIPNYYNSNSYGIIIACSISNQTNTGTPRDLVVEVFVNDIQVSRSVASAPYNVSVSNNGAIGSLTSSSSTIKVIVSSFNSSGTFYGNLTCIIMTEN